MQTPGSGMAAGKAFVPAGGLGKGPCERCHRGGNVVGGTKGWQLPPGRLLSQVGSEGWGRWCLLGWGRSREARWLPQMAAGCKRHGVGGPGPVGLPGCEGRAAWMLVPPATSWRATIAAWQVAITARLVATTVQLVAITAWPVPPEQGCFSAGSVM